MNIVVAGTGYVGLVTGVALANAGHYVTCVDIDQDKVNTMNQGISPIYEPGLDELMRQNMDRLTFTTDYISAYKTADVVFIGVGTPEKKDGSANLSFVYQVALQIAQNVTKDCIVVVKSTVPIGTNDRIEKLLRDNLANDVWVEVVSNPEFLSQGTAVPDTLHASRIVIGAESERAKKLLQQVYENFHQPFVLTNRRSAEMIKYASNDFLALKISYINEIANFCEIIGANIEDVAKGMGYDPRIGNQFLNAGIGYGGSCFPKDTKALHWMSNYYERELKTVKAAIEINESQKLKLIKKSKQYYETLEGLTIAVLGLTFKPNTDDLREAPSLVNIPIMLDEGANVKAWDPVGIKNYKRHFPTEICYCETIEETLRDADLCFIFTEWDEVKNLTPEAYKELMKTPIILDGRNCYRTEKFIGSGVTYSSIGREVIG